MLEELIECEEFARGVAVGINIYQSKVISAHKKKEPLIIDGNLYYIQDGRERLLQEMIDKICE